MSDLRGFSRRMSIRGDNVATNSDRLVRKVALKVDQAVVVGTPVDTGRARSNWIASLGTPARSQIEPYAPGETGSTGAKNAKAALDQAKAVVANYRHGQSVYISNNLPYIGELNDGSSSQAPANFVEEAVHLATESVREAKLLVSTTGGDE